MAGKLGQQTLPTLNELHIARSAHALGLCSQYFVPVLQLHCACNLVDPPEPGPSLKSAKRFARRPQVEHRNMTSYPITGGPSRRAEETGRAGCAGALHFVDVEVRQLVGDVGLIDPALATIVPMRNAPLFRRSLRPLMGGICRISAAFPRNA